MKKSKYPMDLITRQLANERARARELADEALAIRKAARAMLLENDEQKRLSINEAHASMAADGAGLPDPHNTSDGRVGPSLAPQALAERG